MPVTKNRNISPVERFKQEELQQNHYNFVEIIFKHETVEEIIKITENILMHGISEDKQLQIKPVLDGFWQDENYMSTINSIRQKRDLEANTEKNNELETIWDAVIKTLKYVWKIMFKTMRQFLFNLKIFLMHI